MPVCALVVISLLFTFRRSFAQQISRSRFSRVFRTTWEASFIQWLGHCYGERQVNKPNAPIRLARHLSSTKPCWQLIGFNCSLLFVCLATPCRNFTQKLCSWLTILVVQWRTASLTDSLRIPAIAASGIPVSLALVLSKINHLPISGPRCRAFPPGRSLAERQSRARRLTKGYLSLRLWFDDRIRD